MANRHRVVDHIVGYLAAAGVDYVFGVDGANIEDLYDAAYFRADITAVLAKHEFSAATMADGYSRASSRLGVVAATSGGGSLNLVAGLGESFTSRVPVLALVGQPPTILDGRGSFQDTSGRNGSLCAEALFSEISVYCRRVLTPADIVTALPEAVAAARTGGPAVLLLPKNVQQSQVETQRCRRPTASSPIRLTRARVTRIRSRVRCNARAVQSRSSPASRSHATMRAPNWRSCVPRCEPASRPCPTRRTSAGRPAWARRHRLA